MTTLPPLPATFYPSRFKTLLLLIVCMAFVAVGIWMALRGHRFVGVGNACFFGLGIIVGVFQLNPKASYLRLEADGFTFCAMFRSHKVPWRHVQYFDVARIVLNKMLVWNYSADHQDQKKAKALAKSIGGYEAALPDTYGFKAEALCALMNQLRESAKK